MSFKLKLIFRNTAGGQYRLATGFERRPESQTSNMTRSSTLVGDMGINHIETDYQSYLPQRNTFLPRTSRIEEAESDTTQSSDNLEQYKCPQIGGLLCF